MSRRSVSRLALLAALSVTAGTLSSCYGGGATPVDGGDGGASCPNDLPASCPGTPPSYPAEVAPIISARCASCHGPGGEVANHDFTTYDGVYLERSTILSQVYGCHMPPAGAPGLEAGERATLLTWLVCGAPNQ